VRRRVERERFGPGARVTSAAAASAAAPPRFSLGEPQVRLEHVRAVQGAGPSWCGLPGRCAVALGAQTLRNVVSSLACMRARHR
jgi:hypothetical protein